MHTYTWYTYTYTYTCMLRRCVCIYMCLYALCVTSREGFRCMNDMVRDYTLMSIFVTQKCAGRYCACFTRGIGSYTSGHAKYVQRWEIWYILKGENVIRKTKRLHCTYLKKEEMEGEEEGEKERDRDREAERLHSCIERGTYISYLWLFETFH